MSLTTDHRPQRWADIVGQDHVVQTLTNALVTGQLAHAYLFVGTFGSGKTTTARVLAKALNCQHVTRDLTAEQLSKIDTNEGIMVNVEPCGECPSCKSINAGNSLDVKELDMATNRGIDDVRAIKEFAMYSAFGGGYRIFICDEAHQLTQQGASALLKTLEEPPKNVIFILCTTELHKMMDTIRSRCQVFNFKRIDPEVIANRLTTICTLEEVFNYEPEVLIEISKMASGSMRMAESMLSNLISQSAVTMEAFKQMFGASSQTIYSEFFEYIKAKDVSTLLARFDEIREELSEPGKWVEGFALYLFEEMKKNEKEYKFFTGYLELIDKYLVHIYDKQPLVYVRLLLLNMAQLQTVPQAVIAGVQATASNVPQPKDVNDVYALARWFDCKFAEWFDSDGGYIVLKTGDDVTIEVLKKERKTPTDIPYILQDDIIKILRFPKGTDPQTLIDKDLVKF